MGVLQLVKQVLQAGGVQVAVVVVDAKSVWFRVPCP
jgi:hypothetical protein